MEYLVKEGVVYVWMLYGIEEVVCCIDVDVLFDSIVCDYMDVG